MLKSTNSIFKSAALLLALCATTSAWAATNPAAEWDGDFTATQTGYTLNRSGNAISQDNSTITIDQDVGVKVDFTTGVNAMTVMFKYSDLSFDAQKTLATSFCSGGDENRTGVYAASGGTVYGIWNSGAWNNAGQTLSASSGVLAFCYSKSGGTSLYYVSANGTRTELYNRSDLRAGGDTAINGCTIGGERAKTGATLLGAATSMKITGIAIFNSVLSQSEMEGYTFPSDDPTADFDYVATITANTTLGDITTWTKGSGTPEADSKVYIISENNAVLTIDGSLSLNTLKVVGGSITLANGASISSTEIIGADVNIAASTEVTISDSTVWSKIICNGVLNTSGTTSLQGENEFTSTSTLNVDGTKTSLNAGSGKLSGTINVLEGAELENTRDSDALNYGGNAAVNVTGTLNMGSTRWTIGGSNTITLHEGAVVTCANNNGNGALNWNIKNSTPNMIVDGNATLSARIKIIDSATLTIDVASGKTLTIETGGFLNNGLGPVKKTGLGVISNTATTFNINALTVSQGKFISTEFPSGTVSIADGATFTLKNKAWTDQPNRFTGTGTLELRSESASCKHTVTGVTFPGIIKLSNVNTHNTSGAPYWQNNIAPASADMFAENIRPEFILDSDLTHLGDGYYCNNAEHPLRIKNLSGSGEFRGQWSSSVYKYVVETLQERNTTYDGTLGCDASDSNPRCVSLSVIGNNPNEIHSLTITQAINGNDDIGCQTSTLKVADDAKVVFASTGKWGYGNIIVNEDGWLESTNTTAAANITLNDGSTIVVPYVNSATVPLGGTTVTLPADGTVYFDMNGVNIAGGTTVTVISATTLNNGSTASFAAKSGKWDFNVVGNTVTATKKVLYWDGSSWSDDDYSGYTEASIAVSGEASVTLPASLNLQKMALTGSSGSLNIVANNNTLTVGDVIIPNGVTLVSSSALTITGVVSGGGSLVVEGTNLTVYDEKTWTVNSVVVNGTLTLGGATSSISGTVTGAGKIVYPTGAFPSVTGLNAAGWTGKVEIPSIAASKLLTFSLNSLGNTGSTVVLKGIDPAPGGNYQAVYPSEAAIGLAVNPTLQIDGYVSFTFGYSDWAERLKYVTGSGDLRFDYYSGSAPKWHIETLTGFSGSLGASVTYGVELSIGTLALVSGTVPTTADRLVKISNAAGDNWENIINVENTVVTVGGEATEYKLVKKNVRTATAGLYLAPAVIKNGATLTPYDSVASAISAINPYTTYDYVIINESATISQSTPSLKLKKGFENVVLTVNTDYTEYTPTPTETDGVITYALTPKQTVYTWKSTLATGVWNTTMPTPWQYGDSLQANRAPTTCDQVRFASDATITVNENIEVYSILNSANIVFSTTATPTVAANAEGGIVLTAAGASFTVPVGMTLSPAPSTTVDGYYVKRTGTTTYTYTAVQKVASAVINDETVYFDDIDDAFAEITADRSVTVTIINGEGDYDDYDDTIAELGFFREGANVKFLAAEVINANTAATVGKYSTVQAAIDYAAENFALWYYAKVYVSESAAGSWANVLIATADNSVELELTCTTPGYAVVKQTDYTRAVEGLWGYVKRASNAAFTWNSDNEEGDWTTDLNWKIATETATRSPGGSSTASDSVAFSSSASISVGSPVNYLSGITISTDGDGITLTGALSVEDTAVTVGAGGIVLASSTSKLTTTRIALSETPTTSVEGMYVKDAINDRTHVYTVAAKVASVTDSGSNVTYYDSLATAVSSASTGDSIALFANSSEAITLNDKTINFSEGSYTFTGSFTGNGTVIMTAMPKALDVSRWAAGWTGTLWLKDVSFSNLNPGKCGNANSTLKMTGCSGSFNETYNSGNTFAGALELEDEGVTPALTINEGFPVHGYTSIGALKGSGTLASGDTQRAQCFRFVDASEFEGAITISDSSYMRVVFGSGSTIYKSEAYKKIIVEEGASATIASGKTWTAPGGITVDGAMNVSNGGAISGTVDGSGTVTYTGSVTAPTLAAGWTGTVELKDITTVINNFNFANYGTANSTVKMNNVDIHMPSTGGEYGNVGTIEVADGDLRFAKSDNNADSIAGQTFTFAAAIAGTGKIRVGTRCQTDNSAMSFYIFTGDLSDFTGGVDFNETGYYKPTIVFKTVGDTIPQRDTNEWGEILVSEHRTIKLGKEMYAPAGIVLAGAINVLESGSVRVDTSAGKQIRGSGTITYAAFPASAPALNASWAGTISLPAWTTSAAFDINAYGKAGSTIELAGMSSGWIKPPTTGTVAITPNLKLTGTMSLANCSERAYSFPEISGNGTLSVSSTALNSVSIAKIAAGYTGTISNTSGKDLTITTLAREAGTSTASGTKLLATSGADIAVTGVTIGGATQELTLYYADDGVYVDGTVEATTTGEGSEAVTTIETAGNVTSVTVDLGDTYSGKVDLPGNITALTVTGGATVNANQLRLVTTQGTYAGILALSGTAVSLDGTKSVTIEAETVSVTPTVAASAPMTMPGATTAPSFSIKTIPGLYYVVRSGTSPSLLTAGDATQATTTTTGLAGPALGNEDTVRYYKISVGRTAAEAAQ